MIQGKKSRLSLILIAIAAVLAVFLYTSYNGLVKKDEKVNLQWNEVQNAYQRRLDLIPNLVNTVKGGADFEQGTLTKVAQARGSMVSGGAITPQAANKQIEDQNAVASSMNQVIARVERYPELKGTKAFSDLQTQLEGTERRIKIARQDFNAAVLDYNQSVRSFPNNIAAKLFGFSSKEGFNADAGAGKAVEIKF